MNYARNVRTAGCFLVCVLWLSVLQSWAADFETYTFRLTQSDTVYRFWTTTPGERVFRDHEIPDAVGSEIRLYAAKNEFEPFQIVVNPTVSKNITVSIDGFGSGIITEIYQVEYVNITQVSDILGRLGPYPDPLFPIENESLVNVAANQNTAFWFNVSVPKDAAAGDYTANVNIGGVKIPVKLHVFNFAVPDALHVDSQMNFSHTTVLTKYGVTGTGVEYWMYVDKMKQFFIDHRLTPSSPLWSGGLTSSGGAPYIDYNCDTGVLTDPHGIWGFEKPANKYLNGIGFNPGETFNDGTGFPSFMAATFRNNDPAIDQRPDTFCEISKTASDWYSANNPNTPYNKKWFQYMNAVQEYLRKLGYLDRAYHYMANEPQDQADYDAVAWYSQELKKAAPDFRLMVSEEPKPEIFNHPVYTGAKIDIWLPVLNLYNPVVSHDREKHYGEKTWIYFLHGTRPPYFNPITLDHPGIESKLTGWFLWKYRIRGIAYYSMNNWSKNPWTDPLTDGHNGDLFMLYPPSKDNTNIAYGSNHHRFVPSIRFELMRDSLEDYEYLYVLNGKADPVVDQTNPADIQADKLITGLTSYTRNTEFMYNLRRLIGLKNGGEIETIPDIQPPVLHPRAEGPPGTYYINFQNPDETFSTQPYGNPLMRNETISGVTYRMLDYQGKTYYAIGCDAYDKDKGFGWYGNIIKQPVESRDPWGEEKDETKRTYIGDNYGKQNTFEFSLPNGTYNVTLCVGGPRRNDAHNNVTIEGIVFVNNEPVNSTNRYIIRTKTVKVSDSSLSIEIGLTTMDEYTMLNYLSIETAITTTTTTTTTSTTSTTLPLVKISGYIRDSSNNLGIGGVTVSFSNNGGAVTTNNSGYYSQSVAYGWSGTAAPSKNGYTFSQTNRSYSDVTASQFNQDYTGTIITYTVSGYIRDSENKGIPQVSVSFSSYGSVNTDNSGYYSKSVYFGWSGAVTPEKSGYTFNPLNRTYSDVTSDIPVQNYTGIPAAVPDIDVSPLSLIFTKPKTAVRQLAESYQAQDIISENESTPTDGKYATGLIIPEHIREYWKTNTPPRQYRSKRNLAAAKDWGVFDTPVRNQKNCGSCWAFATVALIENLAGQANLSVQKDFAEQVLVSCLYNGYGCSGGWYWDGFNYIRQNGIPPENCYSYKANNGKCTNRCSEPDFLVKINEFTPAWGLWGENDFNVDDLKGALQEGPLAVALYVPDSFHSYSGGIYKYSGGNYEFGHAVLLVGYDDSQRYFRAKNSWGTHWGEGGYFRISYDDVASVVKFGCYAASASGVFIEQQGVQTQEIKINNTGTKILTVKNMTCDKSWLEFSPNTLSTVLPNEQKTITVSVKDWNTVLPPQDTAKITISSDDPDESTVIIELKAIILPTAERPLLMVSPPFYGQSSVTADGKIQIDVSNQNGETYLDVSNGSQGTLNWTAAANDSWLKIIQGSSGINSGRIVIGYDENTGDTRSGTVTISALGAVNSPQTVQISQTTMDDDYDKDGIPNTFEFLYGLDLYNPDDASGDRDGDGLTNLREYQLKTNPLEKDTDEDSFTDGYEVSQGTDPNNPDSYPAPITDFNCDSKTDLSDLMIALKVITNPSFSLCANFEGRIDLKEAIYVLQVISKIQN